MHHKIQDYTEICLRCGRNIWDKDFPDSCSGSHSSKSKDRNSSLDRSKPNNGWGDEGYGDF